MGKYIHTQETIRLSDIKDKSYSLSSSQHVRIDIPNENRQPVSRFLTRKLHHSDLGQEVGSQSYIRMSTHHFIRTKAMQAHSFLPELNGETMLPIIPNDFKDMHLHKGDIIISKDSNIGETAILDKDYPNCMLSSAIYKLPLKKEWKYYLLACTKHQVFREQLDFMVPKGATIRHAKELFLNCMIPLPTKNSEYTVKFVTELTKAIINKEKFIRQRHKAILSLIDKELQENQNNTFFSYKLPTYQDLTSVGRLDSSLYDEFYKNKINKITSYKNGYLTLTEQGLKLYPGPSLEMAIIKTRIDSDTYREGFYRLITPTQISNYGTVKFEKYIGTPARIEKLQYGDILFGESGTGRTMVYLDKDNITINNAHAHVLRTDTAQNLQKAITIRCILQYYKEIGITDCMTVGGSGGHLSPSYFDRIPIPSFPESKQKEIAVLYYSQEQYDASHYDINNFMKYDNAFNATAGIYELDSSQKYLREILRKTIDKIANGQEIETTFDNK